MERKPTTGMSNINMDNSSMKNIKIVGNGKDQVGIHDSNFKNSQLKDILITATPIQESPTENINWWLIVIEVGAMIFVAWLTFKLGWN